MSKGLRLTEKWMQRGLWVVAFVFAGFLVGLGSKIVDNLWEVEPPLTIGRFIEPSQGAANRAAYELAVKHKDAAAERLEQAEQKHRVAASNTRAAHETFENWIATRHATARPEQDADLIARTKELDALKAAERIARAAVQTEQQALLDAKQAAEQASARRQQLEESASSALYTAARAQEMRVFLYRLALTLPLLLIAAWLFVRKRKSSYWPFVWGFIFFALFGFFVELVPYLPSYGGYVRYGVGTILTVVFGRYAIVSLQRYRERQKVAETLPDAQRRETLRYDIAFNRLSKSVCPGCERTVDLKDGTIDFCTHCGIGLFDRCTGCSKRKGAFARFCFACGSPANMSLAE